MIYVRGGRAVRVRRGRRCAPIMINALHPGDNPTSFLSPPPRPTHTPARATHHPIPPFLLHHLLPSLTQDLYLFRTNVPTFSPCRREMRCKLLSIRNVTAEMCCLLLYATYLQTTLAFIEFSQKSDLASA